MTPELGAALLALTGLVLAPYPFVLAVSVMHQVAGDD